MDLSHGRELVQRPEAAASQISREGCEAGTTSHSGPSPRWVLSSHSVFGTGSTPCPPASLVLVTALQLPRYTWAVLGSCQLGVVTSFLNQCRARKATLTHSGLVSPWGPSPPWCSWAHSIRATLHGACFPSHNPETSNPGCSGSLPWGLVWTHSLQKGDRFLLLQGPPEE